MKELSLEEKAKAYDEAIEKLCTFYRDYDIVSCLIDVKEELANRFPELKESEDERIRKSLIGHLKECRNNTRSEVMLDEYVKWIAWLEKQGGKQKLEGLFVNVDDVREDFVQEVYRVFDADSTNDRANQIIDAFDNLPTVIIENQCQTFTKKDVDDAYLKGICDAKHELEKQNEKNEKMKKEIAEFIFNSKEHIKYRYDWIKCLGYDIHFIDKEKQGEQNPVKEYNITDIGSKNAQGKLGEMIKLCMEKPKWCNYPDANKPIWGCWSLLNGKVTSEDYCKDCERYKGE